ncbi:low-affinity phosphate transporter PitH [Marihabitans asiaticum]|uniref:PiT family inorganic phosphate transporter n=1 Tax=Marihabitans asiaticum TaxID=415218 RepID=A0A560WH32_9MICO|nr:inorganic phosphate transporter [Marihabitans asiaticum]TWD16979.1 PiT family inorganic phosphate transporter [Marihabitans asiaticum]
MDWLPVLVIVLLAMAFTYTNGFHDAANAIATSVSTRALTPRAAVTMAALANLVGAFFGARVAETIGAGLVDPPSGSTGLVLAAVALVAATIWNLLTWWLGMPVSSTHALIGALGGAVVVGGGAIHWEQMTTRVLLPMIASPALGLALAYLGTSILLRRASAVPAHRARRGFRAAQTGSAALVAFGHGMQDAAKAAGVVVLALVVSGHHDGADARIPFWLLVLSAVVISAGTLAGGWRIVRTLGARISPLGPAEGFVAEATAALILYTATALHAPISTTHAITASITGAGLTGGARAVRWRVVRSIVLAWVLTFPGAAALAAVGALLVSLA